ESAPERHRLDVGPIRAQFPVDIVADAERDRQHRGPNRRAQRDGGNRHQIAAPLAYQRLSDYAREHGRGNYAAEPLFPGLEILSAGFQAGGGDKNVGAGHLGFQIKGVAPAALPDRHRIDRGRAVLADHLLALLKVAFVPANLTGVKAHAISIGIHLEDYESDGTGARVVGKPVQLAVAYLRDGNSHV